MLVGSGLAVSVGDVAGCDVHEDSASNREDSVGSLAVRC
jgi:hypothetical protein